MHAPHGGAHDETQMVDAQVFRQQPVLGRHHVGIAILREARMIAVTGLARASMTDPVRQDDVVPAAVEQLAGAEQLARIGGRQERPSAASRAMQHHDRIADGPAGIFPGRPQRGVVDAQVLEHLARLERDASQQRIPLFAGLGPARGGGSLRISLRIGLRIRPHRSDQQKEGRQAASEDSPRKQPTPIGQGTQNRRHVCNIPKSARKPRNRARP